MNDATPYAGTGGKQREGRTTVGTMDDEQREYFAAISAQLSGVADDARAAASSSREALSVARRVEGRVVVLERHVFGSDPPPAPPTGSISRQVSEHDSELAALAGQVIAVSSKADKVITMQEEQNKVLAKQNAVLEEQNKQLAAIIGSVGGFFGRPIVQRIGAAIGAILLAWLTAKSQGVLK